MIRLPNSLPLFPLPNAVLFPGILLPLQVFEPRYRALVEDAAAGGPGLIGIVLLRRGREGDPAAVPEIHRVGCAGRLALLERLPDGRYEIILRGVREFEVVEEDRRRPYRTATVRWRRPVAGSLSPVAARRLRALLHRYADDHLPESMRRTFDAGSIPDDYLVNLAASAVESSPLERQALLEAPTVGERAGRLCALIQLRVGARHAGSDGVSTIH